MSDEALFAVPVIVLIELSTIQGNNDDLLETLGEEREGVSIVFLEVYPRHLNPEARAEVFMVLR